MLFTPDSMENKDFLIHGFNLLPISTVHGKKHHAENLYQVIGITFS
jgi:hypothetical protein